MSLKSGVLQFSIGRQMVYSSEEQDRTLTMAVNRLFASSYPHLLYSSIIILYMASKILKNIRGGGLHYVKYDYTSPEVKIFRGGLRHLPNNAENVIQGSRNNWSTYHDKISYERGSIVHARSPSNQFFNFGFMHGGPKKYIWDRLIINCFYRKILRVAWLPFIFWVIVGCWGMRAYDNAAYDYFYFSD